MKLNYIITGVKEDQNFNFGLYPNPVTEKLTIDHPSSGKVTVQLISAYGTLVLEQDFMIDGNIELNLTSLELGVYMVKLTSEGKTASKTIVVQ